MEVKMKWKWFMMPRLRKKREAGREMGDWIIYHWKSEHWLDQRGVKPGKKRRHLHALLAFRGIIPG